MKRVLLIILLFAFNGCAFTSESYGGPEFKNENDYREVEIKIKELSTAESVQFVDIITRKGDNIIKRELRIDLVRPSSFPDSDLAKQIIHIARPRLKDAASFSNFKVNEILETTNVFPSEKISKTISFSAIDL